MKIRSSQTSASTSAGSGQPSLVGTPPRAPPLHVLLFGKRPPRLVDRRKYPGLKKGMRKLEGVKDQIAELIGVPPDELSIALCEGANASISRDGQIAFGTELLERHQNDDDLLVAILGHEIGHQPWGWPEGDLGPLTKRQLDALYREEEAKADRFAGRVLAELGASPEAICRFLAAAEKFESTAPSDYYPAKVRAQMIRDAYKRRARTLANALRDLKMVSPLLLARSRQLR